jgi:hypothetical protein
LFFPPLTKNAPEKKREKKSAGAWVGLGFSKCTGVSIDLFLAAQSAWRRWIGGGGPTRGGRRKKTGKRRASAPPRKKSMCVCTFFYYFFLVRFWAFLGKGSSKTRENNSVRFQKKHRGNIVLVFFCVDFFTFFSFDFFHCVG